MQKESIMKKMQAILSISMLLSLAGCGPKKSKQVAQQVDLFTTTDIPLVADNSCTAQDDEAIDGFFDEDSGEFVFPDDARVADNQPELQDYQLVEATDIQWTDVEQSEVAFQKIYFEFNKYGTLPDQESAIHADAQQIQDVLDSLDEDMIVLIEGHACHSAGSSSYNLALSEKRAKYVRDFLVESGVHQDRIRIVGRGQDIPEIIDGKPITGDRKMQWPNRRVEIHLVDKS